MPEFLQLLSPPEALARLMENLSLNVSMEEVETSKALRRVTAVPIRAPHPLPAFPRTTVDGYAVRAADTYGANDSLPAYLASIGEVLMGKAPEFGLGRAQCALIHTGGMLPEGADAAVMVEHTQIARTGEIEILRAAAVGENVLKIGEDVVQGQEVISVGTRLRPAEIGGLMALGITKVSVAREPKIGIISSGDEVVPPEVDPKPGQVRDINASTLSAFIEETGGLPISYGIIPDLADALQKAALQAASECDAVIITAGSSASTRDLTAQVIQGFVKAGVIVHGVNVRPGKPTILASCNGKPVIGLPGNPVSALIIAWLFVSPVIEGFLGLKQTRPKPILTARLALNIPSQAGREDWVPVSLSLEEQGYRAEPVFGKSNLIFSLTRADGLVRIPPDATGFGAGEAVQVWLF